VQASSDLSDQHHHGANGNSFVIDAHKWFITAIGAPSFR
jgi:glutamate/tyrosine decarboxylase-like PLP-dependent enzyme